MHHPQRLSLALLVTALVLQPTAAPLAAGSSPLQALGVAVAKLPTTVWLVRSPDTVAPAPGLSVHARRGDTWVVSGTAEAIAALAAGRCQLQRVDVDAITPRPAAAPRAWARVAAADPVIQELVDAVVWPEVSAKIAKLSAIPSRHSSFPGCVAAAETLRVFFQRLGLATQFHEFPHGGMTLRNLIATQPGTTRPDSIIVIGAHYDDMPAAATAPGADDNASGVAAVMTAAELLAPRRFAYTIKYVCFGGEEQGTVGSHAWAQWAAEQGLAIVAMLNYDMIAWWRDGVEDDLEVEVGTTMTWLADAITNAAALYTTQPCHVHVDDGAWWGDHYAFWQQGYAAANNEEAWDWGDPDFNPNYHTARDRLVNLNATYALGCTRVAVASLATLARRDIVANVPDAAPRPALTLVARPNPFNPRVTLAFTLPRDLQARVAVYDLAGRRLITLAQRAWPAGSHETTWDGRDARCRPVPSGVYVARVEIVDGAVGRTIVLAR